MKLSSLALFAVVAGLPLGSYLTYRVTDSSSPEAARANTFPETMHANTMPPATLASPTFVRSPDPAPGARADRIGSELQRELAVLRDEFALLRAELSSLQRQVQQRPATSVVKLDEYEDPANDPRNDSVAMAEAEEEYREQMEAIEADFLQEPSDQHWSFEAHTAIHEALSTDETSLSALLDIDCRSQTCRVEMADDNSGNLEKVMPFFIQQLGDTLPNVGANYLDDGNGARTVVLYMSRDTSK